MQALHQLGLQLLAIPVVLGTVFVLSYVFMWIISKGIHGIIREYTDVELREQKIKSSESLHQGFSLPLHLAPKKKNETTDID
jgi:ammonia channel protein AmtB